MKIQQFGKSNLDVKIGEKVIKLNDYILSEKSALFAAIIERPENKDKLSTEIVIDENKYLYNDVYNFLFFIYSKKIEERQLWSGIDKSISVYQVGKYFQCEEFMKFIIDEFNKTLNLSESLIDDVFKICLFALKELPEVESVKKQKQEEISSQAQQQIPELYNNSIVCIQNKFLKEQVNLTKIYQFAIDNKLTQLENFIMEKGLEVIGDLEKAQKNHQMFGDYTILIKGKALPEKHSRIILMKKCPYFAQALEQAKVAYQNNCKINQQQSEKSQNNNNITSGKSDCNEQIFEEQKQQNEFSSNISIQKCNFQYDWSQAHLQIILDFIYIPTIKNLKDQYDLLSIYKIAEQLKYQEYISALEQYIKSIINIENAIDYLDILLQIPQFSKELQELCMKLLIEQNFDVLANDQALDQLKEKQEQTILYLIEKISQYQKENKVGYVSQYQIAYMISLTKLEDQKKFELFKKHYEITYLTMDQLQKIEQTIKIPNLEMMQLNQEVMAQNVLKQLEEVQKDFKEQKKEFEKKFTSQNQEFEQKMQQQQEQSKKELEKKKEEILNEFKQYKENYAQEQNQFKTEIKKEFEELKVKYEEKIQSLELQISEQKNQLEQLKKSNQATFQYLDPEIQKYTRLQQIDKTVNQIQLDSVITKLEDIKFVLIQIIKSTIKYKFQNISLLYRGSKDQFTASEFHSKCDGKNYTLTIIKSNKNKIFGGFTSLAWDKSESYKMQDLIAFLFSIDNKEIYTCNDQSSVIFCHGQFGPRFGSGHDICICDKCNTDASSYSNLGSGYGQKQGILKGSDNAKEKLAGIYNFTVSEIEVFQVNFA